MAFNIDYLTDNYNLANLENSNQGLIQQIVVALNDLNTKLNQSGMEDKIGEVGNTNYNILYNKIVDDLENVKLILELDLRTLNLILED